MAEPSELECWLAYLENRHGRSIDLGLPRVRRVARRLGLLPFPAAVITVAGTNGKGTVTHCAAALAAATGRRTGAYTSPHLLRYNERICIDGIPCDDDAIVSAFEAIEAARGEVGLSYFETATLAALWLFRRDGVELAVLEVGLGGRLDAVNIVDADVAVITRIGLDHQGWLGDTTAAIAVEKAGIARRDQPVVLAEPGYPASLDAALRAAGAQPLRQGREWQWTRCGDGIELHGLWPGPRRVPCPPGLEASNVAAAVCAVRQLLPLPAGLADAVLAQLTVPGRRQRLRFGAGELWLDVAHNPDAAAGLAAALAASPGPPCHALCAIMADKDLPGVFAPLAGQLSSLRACPLPDEARAASAGVIAAAARQAGVPGTTIHDDLADGWRSLAARVAAGGRGIVFGSFHTVAGIMPLLSQTPTGEAASACA